MSLSAKKALVWDTGLYLNLAQRLGEEFGEVWYYVEPNGGPFPTSPTKQIGKGCERVKVVPSFWDRLEKADCLVFFDCYRGDVQRFLKKHGYKVFGSMASERVELDKRFFLETLESVGLPVPKTHLCRGLADLQKYLKGKTDLWLKTPWFRGDFETYHHTSEGRTRVWMNVLAAQLGVERSKSIEVLAQEPIESECEAGYDGFCVNGEFSKNCLIGYEIKDQGFLGKVYHEPPRILADVNRKLSPVFKKLGYQGHYSTEIRITKDGKPYFIDATCRAPSPPSEIMSEIYGNYPEAVWQAACGHLPTLRPVAKYGAQVVLRSADYEGQELRVEYPQELRQWVKMGNAVFDKEGATCIPNGTGPYFGSVVALGETKQEAIKLCLERLEQIRCDGLEYDPDLFDKETSVAKGGEKYGIKV